MRSRRRWAGVWRWAARSGGRWGGCWAVRGWRGVRRWWRRRGGGSCSQCGLGRFGRWMSAWAHGWRLYIDRALGFCYGRIRCHAYDRIPPYSSSSLFHLLPPISEASRSASWTHKPWILYLPTYRLRLSHPSFSAILFRSLLRNPPRLLRNLSSSLPWTAPFPFPLSSLPTETRNPTPPPLLPKNTQATEPHHLRFFLYR